MFKRNQICLAILIFALSVSSVFGAAPQEQEAAEVEEGVPTYGGTLTYYERDHSTEPESPGIANAAYFSLTWLCHIQEKPVLGDLEKYGPRGSGETNFQVTALIPERFQRGHLLESWEITPDEITWHVRPGIHWAADNVDWMENRELTAEDLALDIIAFWKSPWGGRFEGILADVYATDRYTLVIEFENYSGQLMYFLSYEDRAIYSPPELEANGPDKWENQVGTGPFMFDEYVIGSHMSFVRNPNYWKSTTIDGVEYQLPFADRLVAPIIPDVSTQMAALRTGTLDMYGFAPVTTFNTLDRVPGLENAHYSDVGFGVMLRNDEPPFNDENVRRAMMIGTDLKAFARFGQAGDLPAHWWPSHSGNPDVYTPLEELDEDSQTLYEYDLELAKQMLADAGYPNGFEVDYFITPLIPPLGSEDLAALVKDSWSKIGVEVNIRSFDSTTFTMYRQTNSYTNSMQLGTQVGNPLNVIGDIGTIGGDFNIARYRNELVDELVTEAKGEMDFVQRDRLLKEASVHIIDEVPFVPLYLAPQGHYWWPWLRNYFGELSLSDGFLTEILPYIWIDQDLKAAMGF